MSDLNWCTYCDNAVNPFSESLYCSEQCLRADALRNHPLLGYTYPEFTDFPRPNNHSPSYHEHTHHSNYSSASASPALSATSSKSSIQFSPPKFDLLSNSTSLPPVTTTTTVKSTHFNYISIFEAI